MNDIILYLKDHIEEADSVAAALFNCSEVEVRHRRELVTRAIALGDDFAGAYLSVIADKNKADGFLPTSPKRPLPSAITVAKNAAQAGKQALLSGFKQVSAEEQKQRHAICQTDCQYYRHEDDRCSQCGCFTSFKSRLEAWHCQIGKW